MPSYAKNFNNLIAVCKEAVKDAEKSAESQHRAEGMTAAWTSYLPSWHGKMVAALSKFGDPAMVEMGPREDLDPITKARGIKAAMATGLPGLPEMSTRQIAETLSMPEPSVVQYLKLLDFPVQIQDDIQCRRVSFSAARLIRASVPKELWQEAIDYAKTHDFYELSCHVRDKWG